MEHTLSVRILQVGLLFVLVAAGVVESAGPNGLWRSTVNAAGTPGADRQLSLRHEAVLHNAHTRLDQAIEDGVESARAADLAIKNLDCWERELKAKGETEKALACREGFEFALAAVATPKFSVTASLRVGEP